MAATVCSFKATINFLIWNDVELVGLQNCYLGFSKFWKVPKISKNVNIFLLFQNFPSQNIFSLHKTEQYVRGQWLINMCTNFKSISSKMAEIWHKTCQKQALFTSFRDFTVIFLILFFDRFWCFKQCFRVIFAFFEKIWLRNMYSSSKSHFFAWPFLPGDLPCPWPLLWSQNRVNDTYKCQRYYLCRLVGFVCP